MGSLWVVRLLRLLGFSLVLSAELYLVSVLGQQYVPATHFGYFTVLSNVLAAVVLLAGVFVRVDDRIRGATTLYLLTTGIVYAVLLRGIDVQTPSYANVVLHEVMPVLVVLDWVLDPPRKSVGVGAMAAWLAFPVAYLGFTLVRGPFLNWYPYPFLDPRLDGGYWRVGVICLCVALAVGLLAWAVAAVGNRLGSRRRGSTDVLQPADP